MQPKRCGNCGWYFIVLKWLSENGLSLEVCGRLWDLVTPRSASRSATQGQRPGQTGALTVDAGARHVQSRTGAGSQTRRWRQGYDRVHHDLSSLSGVASGIPSRAATFFWISMIASACSNLRPSRAISRLDCASSAVKGFRAVSLGPRLVGVSAPRTPLSRCRRQSVRVDEYKPSRRRIALIPPTSTAPSVSAKTRSFVCAVKVRRRGRFDISGAAAAGAGTYGRPPASLRTGPGGTVRFRFFVLHDHVMVVLRPCEAKLSGLRCLTIIGTEGDVHLQKALLQLL